MARSLFRLAIKLTLCSAFVHLPALLLGLQLHTVGKLVINSAPSTGASIFINQNPSNQQTNFTFALTPGTYWVAVTGGPDDLKCGGPSGQAVITPGSVVTLTCNKGSNAFVRQ